MRTSKSRSRNKPNRPRPVGNVVNRVFDSSGPEGKVRGTPQQIIDKYLTLARDAQLSNDRVAEQSFLQHAEHYTRLLAEAMREQAERQSLQNQQQGSQQHGGNGHSQQNGSSTRSDDDRDDDRARGDQRRQDDRGRDDRSRDDRSGGDDRRRDDRSRDERPREERGSRDDRSRDDRTRDDRKRENRSSTDRGGQDTVHGDDAGAARPSAEEALPDAIDPRADDQSVSVPEAEAAPVTAAPEAASADVAPDGANGAADKPAEDVGQPAENAITGEADAAAEPAPRRRTTTPRARTPRARKPAANGDTPIAPERASGE